MHIRAEAVEKDWWVTQVLKALFLSEYSKNIVFKGGTSLSKGWKHQNGQDEQASL
ncbi:MAG: nucleotidyl transferase AbiEii/AbiGii toxin family protein [Spirochaetales bacterium]|nr:nucleotidyl transferase AbiEii/AbiGii toxin family protein [Spirochaetales bacterium]